MDYSIEKMVDLKKLQFRSKFSAKFFNEEVETYLSVHSKQSDIYLGNSKVRKLEFEVLSGVPNILELENLKDEPKKKSPSGKKQSKTISDVDIVSQQSHQKTDSGL